MSFFMSEAIAIIYKFVKYVNNFFLSKLERCMMIFEFNLRCRIMDICTNTLIFIILFKRKIFTQNVFLLS